jgi:hypothetical protein
MTTSNISTKGEGEIPNKGCANFICAVDDIGRNSVRPSIMAMMMDCIVLI